MARVNRRDRRVYAQLHVFLLQLLPGRLSSTPRLDQPNPAGAGRAVADETATDSSFTALVNHSQETRAQGRAV
jgi:hypothetical protein